MKKEIDKPIISAKDYVAPKFEVVQDKIILKDIEGNLFEAIYIKPSLRVLLEMENYSNDLKVVGEGLFSHQNKAKKLEYILGNIITAPAIVMDILSKESADKLLETFR